MSLNQLGPSLHDILTQYPDLTQYPNLAINAAGSASTTDPQVTSALINGAQLKQQLDLYNAQSDPVLKSEWWNSLSTDNQQALMAAGFEPPADVSASSGQALVSQAQAQGVWQDVKSAGSSLLHWLGAPLRAVQHAYRAGGVFLDWELGNQDKTNADGQAAAQINYDFSKGSALSDWKAAWQTTSNGEQFFAPEFYKTIGVQYASDPMKLWTIRQAAMGVDPAQVASQLSTAGYDPTVVSNWLNSQEFSNAVQVADTMHASIGRDVARLFGLTPKLDNTNSLLNPQERVSRVEGLGLFNKVSGTVDAAADWFGDPTIIAGKISKGIKVARYGLGPAQIAKAGTVADGASDTSAFMQRLQQVTQQPAVRRYLLGTGSKDGKIAEQSENVFMSAAQRANPGLLSVVHTARTGSGVEKTNALTKLRTGYKDTADSLKLAMLRADKDSDFSSMDGFLTWARENGEIAGILKGSRGVGVPMMGNINAAKAALKALNPRGAVAQALDAMAWKRYDDALNSGFSLARPDYVENFQNAARAYDEINARYAGRSLEDLTDDERQAVNAAASQVTYWGNKVAADSGAARSIIDNGEDVGQVVTDPSKMEQLGTLARRVYDGSRTARMGQALRRLQLDAWNKQTVNLGTDRAVQGVRNIAAAFLAPQQADTIQQAFNAANLAGRKQIMKGTLLAAGKAAGMDGDAYNQWSTLVAKATDSVGRQYGLTDLNLVDGQQVGWRARDMAMDFTLPDFRTMYDMAKKGALTNLTYRAGNNQWADFLVGNVWRASVLLRPALVLRNIVDEGMSFVFSEGWKPWLAGSLLRKEAIGARRAALLEGGEVQPAKLGQSTNALVQDRTVSKDTSDFNEMLGTTARVMALPARGTELLTNKALNAGAGLLNKLPGVNLTAPSWEWAGRLGLGVENAVMSRRFLSGPRLMAIEKLTGVDRNTIDDLIEAFKYNRDDAATSFLNQVRLNSHYSYKDKDQVIFSPSRAARAGGSQMDLAAYLGDTYSRYGLIGTQAGEKWLANIVHEWNDQISRTAMQNILDHDQAIERLTRLIESPGMQWYRDQNLLYNDQGAHAVAEVAYQEMYKLLGGSKLPDGFTTDTPIIRRLFAHDPEDNTLHLSEGNMSADMLDDIKERPDELFGRDVLWFPRTEAGRLAKVLDSGYRWMGEATAAITREPMYMSELLKARSFLKPYQEITAAILTGKTLEEARQATTNYMNRSALYDHENQRPVPMYETLDDDGHLFGQEFTRTKNRADQRPTAFLDVRNPLHEGSPLTQTQTADFWRSVFGERSNAGRAQSRIARGTQHEVTVPLKANGRPDWAAVGGRPDMIKTTRTVKGSLNGDGEFVLSGAKPTHARISYVGQRTDDFGVPAVNSAGKAALERAEALEQEWRTFLNRDAGSGREAALRLSAAGSHQISFGDVLRDAQAYIPAGSPGWTKFWDRADRWASKNGFDSRNIGDRWSVFNANQIRKPYVPGTYMGAEDWAQDIAGQMFAETAHQQAVENLLGFVDNPEARSQFATFTRNYMPFYRAQENALKRYAKALKADWGNGFRGLSHLQMMIGGLKDSGFITQADDGSLQFSYPGAGEANAYIADVLAQMHFGGIQVPTPFGLMGQLKNLNPITDPQNSLVPSLGPILALPLNIGAYLSSDIPAIRNSPAGSLLPDAQAFLIGSEFGIKQGTSIAQSTAEGLLPAFFRRLIRAGAVGDTQDLNNATLNSMRALYVAGKGLPQNATPEQKEQWISDVKSTTKNMLMLKAFMGLFAPTPIQNGSEGGGQVATFKDVVDPTTGVATPILTGSKSGKLTEVWQEAGHYTLNDQYRALLRSVKDPDVALTLWLAGRDDLRDSLLELKVGNTTVPSKTTWSSTANIGTWLDQNRGWVQQNQTIAPYFFPADGKQAQQFSYNTYLKEMADGLRVAKAPADMVRDLQIAAAQDTFFRSQDAYEAYTKDLHGKALENEQNSWSDWEKNFLAANPAFAAWKQDFGARALERQQIIQGMQRVVDQGIEKSPNPDVFPMYQALMDAYNNYTLSLNQLSADRSQRGTLMRSQLKTAWQQTLANAASVTDENPMVRAFINRVLQYDN